MKNQRNPDLCIFSSTVPNGFLYEISEDYSDWPDFPRGVIATGWAGVQYFTHHESDSVTYQSHYGSKSYWHSMRKGNQTPQEVKYLMLHDISRWTNRAQELISIGKNQKDQVEINKNFNKAAGYLGMMIHIIEDSYCPSHVRRNNSSQIEEFYDYSLPLPGGVSHASGDKKTGNEIYFNQAVNAVVDLLDVFFNMISNNGSVLGLKRYLSENVLDLKE
jgi:hypothetical protein